MIVVAPLHELEDALARWRPSHVVSLASPGAEPARLPDKVATLRLAFHDIVAPRPGLRMATDRDVDALLRFGSTWPGRSPLLIHCWAGVSRSPAAAYVVACARSPASEVQDLALRLRHQAPFATPNRHLVALADARLARGGAMTAAIDAIARGAETSLGRSFSLGGPGPEPPAGG